MITYIIAFSSINVGLVAFVYPKVFETMRSLKDISQIFIDKLQRNFFVRYYLCFVAISLLVNLFSFPFCYYPYIKFLFFFNFWLTIASVIWSWYVFHVLTLYYNRTEELFKVKKINLSPKSKNEDLELIQMISIHLIKKGCDVTSFGKYLEKIKEIFKENILSNINKINQSTFLNTSEKFNYLFRPLEIMNYIFQNGVDLNIQEISNDIFNMYLNILKDIFLEWNHTPAFQVEKKVIDKFTENIRYKTIRGKIYKDDLIFLCKFYSIIFRYYKEKIPYVNQDINLSFKPNDIIFNILQSMIDYNISIELLKFWQDLIQDKIQNNEIDCIQILRLNIQILSYLIFKEKYHEAYQFMYYETPKDNYLRYSCPQIPLFLSDIFWCYVGKDSTFLQNQTFEKNQRSDKFKYFILFLLLCNAQDRYENLKKQIQKMNNNIRKGILQIEKERYSDISDSLINQLSSEEMFFNNFNNQEYISEILNNFFENKALITTFQITQTYKQFILDKIKKFHEKVVKRREPIIKGKLSNDLRDIIKKYSQNVVDELTQDNFNSIFDTKPIRKKVLMDFIHSILFKTKLKSEKDLGKISVTQEKGRLLVYDNLEQTIYNLLLSQVYQHFFNKLIDITKPINDIKEIPDIKQLANYCIITNFDNYKNIFQELLPKENIIVDKLKTFVNFIKIGKIKIPIIKKNYLFCKNFCEKHTILLIELDRKTFHEIEVEEIPLSNEKVFDDLFHAEYSTDKEIKITIPSLFDIKYQSENIGYCLTREKSQTHRSS